MATPKELVSCLSALFEIPVATIAIHDRNLAEAGLRRRSLRGRGISSVDATDAANLIIAAMASSSVKNSVSAVKLHAKTARLIKSSIDAELSALGAAKHNDFKVTIPLKDNGDLQVRATITWRTIAAMAFLIS